MTGKGLRLPGRRKVEDPRCSRWAIVADNLTKCFPGVRALDDVSVSIYAGEIAALLGQNGAGKIDADPSHVRFASRRQLFGAKSRSAGRTIVPPTRPQQSRRGWFLSLRRLASSRR